MVPCQFGSLRCWSGPVFSWVSAALVCQSPHWSLSLYSSQIPLYRAPTWDKREREGKQIKLLFFTVNTLPCTPSAYVNSTIQSSFQTMDKFFERSNYEQWCMVHIKYCGLCSEKCASDICTPSFALPQHYPCACMQAQTHALTPMNYGLWSFECITIADKLYA